jgi:hypothetical protein
MRLQRQVSFKGVVCVPRQECDLACAQSDSLWLALLRNFATLPAAVHYSFEVERCVRCVQRSVIGGVAGFGIVIAADSERTRRACCVDQSNARAQKQSVCRLICVAVGSVLAHRRRQQTRRDAGRTGADAVAHAHQSAHQYEQHYSQR